MNRRLRVLSLGAGVQSTTMALMATAGEIEPPDCAIFSDTGWEPKAVYEHLHRLIAHVSFPVHIVQHGNIKQDMLSKIASNEYIAIPFYIKDHNGKSLVGRRQCTREYKLAPLYRKCREILGVKAPKPNSVEMLIGISIDEAHRMKPSLQKYVKNTYPLIDLRMSRNDCKRWLRQHGWSAPKSSCIGCPLRSNVMWRELKKNNPQEWLEAIEMDKKIRNLSDKGEQFTHYSLKPLDQIDLSTPEERGQMDMFGNECEGMCGV